MLFLFRGMLCCYAQSASLEKHPLQIPLQTVEKELSSHIHPNPAGPNTIGYFYIGNHESMISESTWLYIKQGLDYYKKNRPLFIFRARYTWRGGVCCPEDLGCFERD